MLARWEHGLPDVWEQMERMRRELDRVWGRTWSEPQVGVYPALNVFDEGERLVARAEVPGMDAKKLDIDATSRTLTIAGERRRPPVDERSSVHRRERGYGQFKRAITLPQEIDPDKVEARYRHGVLEVVMPKAEAVKPRKIQVAS